MPAEQHADPADEIDRGSWSLAGSGAGNAELVRDGSRRTAWRTDVPQRPGDRLEIHLPAGNTAAATASNVALGLLYGAIALCLSGATGRRALSLGVASGLAGAGYLYTSLAPFVSALNDNLANTLNSYVQQVCPVSRPLKAESAALARRGVRQEIDHD